MRHAKRLHACKAKRRDNAPHVKKRPIVKLWPHAWSTTSSNADVFTLYFCGGLGRSGADHFHCGRSLVLWQALYGGPRVSRTLIAALIMMISQRRRTLRRDLARIAKQCAQAVQDDGLRASVLRPL